MESPIGLWASLAASGTQLLGTIPINYNRTIYLTLRGTFNGSGTGNLRVNALYSPDGKHWDNEACDYFDLTVVQSGTQQTTGVIAVPEHGYLQIQVQNMDASYAITNVTVWASYQSWPTWKRGAGGIMPNIDAPIDSHGGD